MAPLFSLWGVTMSDKPKNRVGVLGAAVAVLGAASAFLSGVNWNVIFSQEGAAVAGATVGFVGAGVVLYRAVESYIASKRNG